MPIVSKAFKAVRPGDIYPSTIAEGEEVSGRLAEIAAALDCLERPAPQKTAPEKQAAKAAPANKAAKAAPESKG